MNIDITPIFWEIVSNITKMEYDQLSDTESFKDLCRYEKDSCTYILHLDDISLTTYPQDLNDLFYGTLRFYKAYSPHSVRYLLMKKCLERIEKYMQIDDDITDMLNSSFFS